VHFLHFYGTPFVGAEVLEKIEDLVRLVNAYQPFPRTLVVVPFGKIQETMALATSPKIRTILYRRMMMRIGSRIARRMKLHALVTGESLGQVASQTLENLSVINAASDLPVLRPLLGHDKDEIVEEAHRMGTFATSVRPGLDCCTLFADRHPAIRVNAELVAEEEAKLDIEGLIARALEGVEIKKIF
jgi:thiamine biosynthesis protein ThiI